MTAAATATRSTTDDIPELNHPATVWARRVMLGLLVVLLVAGLLTILGVHSSATSTEADGYRIQVIYPRVARAGLDVPWEVTVSHPGGFGKELELAVDGHYFDLFESQGFRPEPSDETREGDTYYLTFTGPPGDTFRVYFDGYIQPASQVGRSGWVAVVQDHHLVARTDYSTWLWP